MGITGINDEEEVKSNLKIEITDESGTRVFNKDLNTDWKSGVSRLFKQELKTRGWSGNYEVSAVVTSENGKVINENTAKFSVFNEDSLTTTDIKIAVIDPDRVLSGFLKKSGIQVLRFSSSTDVSIPVLVGGTTPKSNTDKKALDGLFDFAKKGGTVVYLKPTNEDTDGSDPYFPITADAHPAVGLWTCIPHMVHHHPIFEGLPSGKMMRGIYENVWPRTTLRNLKGTESSAVETIVGTVAFDWFSVEHKMNYSGPGSSWWGSDLAIIPSGRGRYVISQLRLLENLGKDPVADKILLNMINFLAKN
ncbi:MAG: hypothetical protein AAF361_06440 [Bacteroidota bacterium]